MAVTVAWEDAEHTIVCLTFPERWTIDELRSAGIQSILMLRSVEHPVYVISDFTGIKDLPVGMLTEARNLNQMRPPNWAAGITVTQDILAKDLLEFFGQVYLGERKDAIFVVKTKAEAYGIVDKLKKDQMVS